MNRTQICPIIFADIVGSSKITDDRLKTDLNRLVHRLLDEIKDRFQVLPTKHTGDGFFVCGVDGAEMAEAALSVRDHFRKTDWVRAGFSGPVAIRICIDLQKVNLIEENGRILDVSSSGIDRAARIEPVVAPNEVWCTDHFFSQLRAENVRNIGGTAIGVKQLAKGAGEANLFALHWSHEAIPQPVPQTTEPPPVRSGIAISIPRIKRSISDVERDQFAAEAIQEISTYFQEALGVLERDQHPHVQCRHTQVTPNKFTAEVYVDGKNVGRCKIWLSGRGREICYSQGHFQIDQDNGYNESLHVHDDGRDIYLKAMGMVMMGQGQEPLSVKNAAMYLWEAFTRPLSH